LVSRVQERRSYEAFEVTDRFKIPLSGTNLVDLLVTPAPDWDVEKWGLRIATLLK
jgi:hypothetical protein